MRPVIGMYAYGAFATMECSDKKVPYKVMEFMQMKGMAKLKLSGFDMRRVFLTNVITQRRKRTKKIRYHAKGKMGRVYRDYCTFRLEFTEKPLKDFYKQLIEGKTPPALSYMLGEQLRRRQADYATVRKLQPLLHAKGRSMARINFRRRCWADWVHLKQEAKSLDFKLIWEKRLEEEAAAFEARYGDMFNDVTRKREERLAARKEIFNRNQASG